MSWESLVNRHKEHRKETSEIDQTFASVFSGPDGKKLLEFFDSIVMNVTINPNADSRVLWHLEGQRYLVGLIERHIQRSHKVKNNE